MLPICLEPSLLHFLQEIFGDREAGGITYYGVCMAEGTFGSRWIIGHVVRDFGWREDFAATEAAALFRLLYLFLVSDAAIVSLAEDSVFLLLFFLLFLSLLQITLESSLKIERHMIVRSEDIQRRNMVVVFVAGTIYHGIAVVRLIVWQFIQSSFILGSLVSLPYPFRGERSTDNDGKFHLIATIYFHDVTLLESDLFSTSASEGLVRMSVVCCRIADSGIVDAETRTAVRPVDLFFFAKINKINESEMLKLSP